MIVYFSLHFYDCAIFQFTFRRLALTFIIMNLSLFSTVIPLVGPLNNTEDYLVGALLIADPGTEGVSVTVNVHSDPCPTVQWSFNGMPISLTDSRYTISNPCNDSGYSLDTIFLLSIAQHTSSTSGEYTAVFSHSGGSSATTIYITVPGKSVLHLRGISVA